MNTPIYDQLTTEIDIAPIVFPRWVMTAPGSFLLMPEYEEEI